MILNIDLRSLEYLNYIGEMNRNVNMTLCSNLNFKIMYSKYEHFTMLGAVLKEDYPLFYLKQKLIVIAIHLVRDGYGYP